MSSVTYRHQPAIHKTGGSVPNSGTEHPYTVSKILWPTEVEEYIRSQIVGTSLHVCSGLSKLGDIRLDLYQENIDVRADAARLPFKNRSFDTVVCDPPYNGKFQWNHDMLNELHRVASKRVVFQHWYIPINNKGQFKKAHVFTLNGLAAAVEEHTQYNGEIFNLVGKSAWMPRTYFGRMQIISTFDREEG